MSDELTGEFVPTPDATLDQPTPPAVVPLGEFEILGEAGWDGPFPILRARQIRLNRIVWLKIPPAGASDELIALLRTEAETASRFEHPNIVRVVEAGNFEGTPFIAFNTVEGETLADRLKVGPVPPRLAADWTRQIAETLFHAHQLGVHHLNLRPEFVIIGRDGQIRLGGFGTSARPGVCGFTAPERLPGFATGSDGRTDVYGVGALLGAMLTGRPPFAGDGDELEANIRTGEEPTFDRRVGDLEAICKRCLAREPFRRYGGRGDASVQPMMPLIADLRRYLGRRPIRASKRRHWRGPLLWLRRNLRPIAVALIVLLGISGSAWLDRHRLDSDWGELLQADPGDWVLLRPTGCESVNGSTFRMLPDQSILATGEPPKRDTYTFTATVPADMTGIGGVRLEAMTDATMTAQGRDRPGGPGRHKEGNFVFTDFTASVGSGGSARPIAFRSVTADHNDPNYPVMGTIDADPINTGWSIWDKVGQPHVAEFQTEPLTVTPGEPIAVTLRFDSPHDFHLIGRFRLALCKSGRTNDRPVDLARITRRLETARRDRPHNDELVAALALARLRAGQIDEALKILPFQGAHNEYGHYPRLPGTPIELPRLSATRKIDPDWQPALQFLWAQIALRRGQYTDSQGAIRQQSQYGQGPGQQLDPRTDPGRALYREYSSLCSDSDIISASVVRGDRLAIGMAGSLKPTPELVKGLILQRVNFANSGDDLHYEMAGDRIILRADERVARQAGDALAKLNLGPNWLKHEGARRAIPGLVVTLTAFDDQSRKSAESFLNQIDPNWPRSPEARRAIPSLLTRTVAFDESRGHGNPSAGCWTVLARIDPEWTKAPEAREAVPVLAAIIAEKSEKARDADRWSYRTFQAADTLARLGPTAVDAVPILKEAFASLVPEKKWAAFAALAAVDPTWLDSNEGQDALLSAMAVVSRDKESAPARALARSSSRVAAAATTALVLALPNSEAEAALMRVGDWAKTDNAIKAVPRLVERLTGGDPTRRVEAAWVLSRLGERAAPAVPALIEALGDCTEIDRDKVGTGAREWFQNQNYSKLPVNYAFVNVLDHIAPKWLNDPQTQKRLPEIVAKIVTTKTEYGQATKLVLPRLTQQLPDREAMAAVLPKLTAALDDNQSIVREGAVVALGWAGLQAAPSLARLAATAEATGGDHGSEQVRAAANKTVVRILSECTRLERAEPDLSATIELLTHSSAEIRKTAAEYLDSIVPQWRSSPELKAAVTGWESRLRELPNDWRLPRIAEALSRAKAVPPWAVAKLIEQLNLSESRACAPAIAALGELGPMATEAVPKLAELRQRTGEYDRRPIDEALAKIGTPPVSELLDRLSDLKRTDRDTTIALLDRADSKWRTSRAVGERLPEWVRATVDANMADRSTSLRLLLSLGRTADLSEHAKELLPMLITSLATDDCALAAKLFGNLGASNAKPALIERIFTTTGANREAVWSALHAIEPKWLKSAAWRESETVKRRLPELIASVVTSTERAYFAESMVYQLTEEPLDIDGVSEIVPKVVPILDAKEHNRTELAAKTLGWTGWRGGAAVPKLAEKSHSQTVIQAITRILDNCVSAKQATAPTGTVIGLLAHPRQELRKSAGDYLDQLVPNWQSSAELKPVALQWEVRIRDRTDKQRWELPNIVEALVRAKAVPSWAVTELVAQLRDPNLDSGVVIAALGILGPAATDAVPELVRMRAAGKSVDDALTKIGTPPVTELYERLTDLNRTDQETTIGLLDRADSNWRKSEFVSKRLPEWVKLAVTGKGVERRVGLVCLSIVGPTNELRSHAKELLPVLTEALTTDAQRIAAVRVLGSLGPTVTDAPAPLIECLTKWNDTDTGERFGTADHEIVWTALDAITPRWVLAKEATDAREVWRSWAAEAEKQPSERSKLASRWIQRIDEQRERVLRRRR